MSEILIQSEDLQQVVNELKSASENLATNMQKIDNSISTLERKWSGATQQVFYHKYKDLHRSMEGMSALMNNIANEMLVMAERMSKIDTNDKYQG
jgi:WXG100 family type VII secretion target